MKSEKIVYLLVGQRGSGKSGYIEKILKNQNGFYIISRDEILIRLFGSTDLNPYTGGHCYAFKIMRRLISMKLSSSGNIKLILDCWTGNSSERKALIKGLQSCGATKIIALYFMTPLETVKEWFWKKPGIKKIGQKADDEEHTVFFSEDAPERDYEIFHNLAKDINSDGFDKVVRIDPTQPVVVL